MTSQPDVLVAFQGEHGAYSEEAAVTALGRAIQTLPQHSFEEVFESVQEGRAGLGIVPVENSLAGSIHRNYDLLLRHNLYIVGETQLRIEHCLLANPGVSLADIKTVRSHPQALAQCESHLQKMGVVVEPTYDTAGSARDIRDSGDRSSGAIASRLAAEVYGMTVLQTGMEDDRQNYTRFLILSRSAAPVPEEAKTSIVFALKNQPGVLFRALACFALRDIDLTKIESRPIPGQTWKYRFYLDYIGRQDDGPGRKALDHLAELATEVRVLGTYPRGI